MSCTTRCAKQENEKITATPHPEKVKRYRYSPDRLLYLKFIIHQILLSVKSQKGKIIMDAIDVLYGAVSEEFSYDTPEYSKAYDYFEKCVEYFDTDKAHELLSWAVSAEGKRAFNAGVRAALSLMGGRDD